MTLELALLGRSRLVLDGRDLTTQIGDKPLANWAAMAAIALDEARGKDAKGIRERVQKYLN